MKTNKEAKKALRRIYNNLARSVEASADLAQVFRNKKDKRLKKAEKLINLVMDVQEFINPMGEDEDIGIV